VGLVDTIEVTTFGMPLSIKETGRSVTVLNSEDIALINATSVDELLQRIPGVELQSRSGFGVQSDIIIRGSTFTQVLVLIDGMRMNDPLTGHFNSYIPITIPEIHKIEILRGAASAMFGPDAVGGTINIITKTGMPQQFEDASSGQLSYGSNNLIDVNLGSYTTKGKVKISGGVAVRKSDGEQISEEIIDSTTILESYKTFFDIKTVGAGLSYKINDIFSLKARTNFDHRDFAARYFYTASKFDKSTETVSNWWNQIGIIRTKNGHYSDLNISYKNNTDKFVFSPDFPSTNNHTTDYLNLVANHFFSLSDSYRLKLGAQIDKRYIKSNDRGNHSDVHTGFYGMLSTNLSNFNSVLAGRVDYDDNYGIQFLPSLNASYILKSIVFRGSIGKSIRAADYTERFVSNNLSNLTPGRNLGNPDLLSETSWSTELGADIDLSSNWIIGTTIFGRKSDDLIDYTLTNQSEIGSVSDVGSIQAGEDYFFAKNVTNVQTIGLEFSSLVSFPFGQNRIDFRTGYTYQNTTNDEEEISRYIANAANHLLTNRLMLKIHKFNIGINSIFKERQSQMTSSILAELSKSYFVWDLDVKFNMTKNFQVGIDVINVSNLQYQNILGAPMPSRWLKLRIFYNL
jgi:iron complex outermembrane receptor protein